MQTHLILMACSATKKTTPAPAIDLYQGVMYSTFRANTLATMPAVIILSAKHGFIEADRVIDPYEQRMTDARAGEMLAELQTFDAIAWPHGVRSIFLAGGKTYRRVMRAAIERRIELGLLDRDVTIEETDGAGIGYQRAQLGAYLRTITTTEKKDVTAIIIYGPKGSGKTTHAKALAAHYGKANIVDDFAFYSSRWRRVSDMPADTLFITSHKVSLDGPGKDSFIYIDDACRAAGLTPHPMLSRTSRESQRDDSDMEASRRSNHPAHLFVDAVVARHYYAPARSIGKALAYEAIGHAIGLGIEPHRIADVAHDYIEKAIKANA
jgi:hypothetical protein